ncbi:YeeE/YedE family protein [Agitococcus lubricus]|uniref:Uncharacterized protein n=1 Tax=Agitococcus lubricus TaxID=1077255 RepID=A0A2T5J3G4_9GAMM|nr:YeeE/YedE family protein [Agitococcus lubricus]PTQ91132.1 hypothetical protein C8N29_101204 [Agitococcus lubricus]
MTTHLLSYPLSWQRTVSASLVLGCLFIWAYNLSLNTELDPNLSLSLLFGIAFGVILQRSRFCFYCISNDFLRERKIEGVLGIIVALAIGTLGYHTIFGAFLPEATTGRLPPNAHIGPVSIVLILAAGSFGVGMALAGSCISALFYRLGEGYFAGLIPLFGTLLGFILGFYVWNDAYLWTIQSAPIVWLPSQWGYATSLLIQLSILTVLVIAFQYWGKKPLNSPTLSLKQSIFIQRWPTYVGGILMGMLSTLAFLRLSPLGVTAELGSVARTIGHDLPYFPERLEGLDNFRGCMTMIKETLLSRNGLLVIGLIGGSLSTAILSGDFKPTRPQLLDIPRLFIGGILMGLGSMLALGCTIGTLLSGIMAAALSGWVFLIFCTTGLYLGWKIRQHI